MSSHSHDPREHIRGIHQILVSDKKRIGFLFGAGSSFATGVDTVKVPAVAAMTEIIVQELSDHSSEFQTAIDQIKSEIQTANTGSFNIESLLSKVEAKRAVIGSGVLNGLNANQLTDLANNIKVQIKGLVSVHEYPATKDDPQKLAHWKLVSWICKARRKFPVEIFTTNYDYLFEIALEGNSKPFFDGFSGSFEPFFCAEAVEDVNFYADLVKLWKLHGSLGWREHHETVIRDKTASGEDILIYPSHLKYNASKKQPYIGLIDRLCTFLQQDDAVLFTCGYSFGDNHINERIVTSLRRGANSNVFAMYYDEYLENGEKNYALADPSNHVRCMAEQQTGGRMSVYGLRNAVIGGLCGDWRLRDEPKKAEAIRLDQYFDEDGSIPDQSWQGTGNFHLPNFPKLASFLDGLSSCETADGVITSYQ